VGQIHQIVSVEDGVALREIGHLVQDQEPAKVDRVDDLQD
jgi:hypothetical protein